MDYSSLMNAVFCFTVSISVSSPGKSDWIPKSSTYYLQDTQPDYYEPYKAIDGADVSTFNNFFHTALTADFGWFQLDFGELKNNEAIILNTQQSA